MNRLSRRVEALDRKQAPGFVVTFVSPPDGTTKDELEAMVAAAAKDCEPHNAIVVLDRFPKSPKKRLS